MANTTQSEESTDRGDERPRATRSRSAARQTQPPSLLPDVDRLWESFIERFGMGPAWPLQIGAERLAPFAQRPRIDIAEGPDNVIVTAEIPGFRREDIDVSITDDMLTLRAEQSSESEREQAGYHRREIMRGSCVRHVRLPCPVDVERATADYRDGMLTVTMPKTARARSRKIPLGGESPEQSGEKTH